MQVYSFFYKHTYAKTENVSLFILKIQTASNSAKKRKKDFLFGDLIYNTMGFKYMNVT